MNNTLKYLAEDAGMAPWGIGNDDNVTEIVERYAELIIKEITGGILPECGHFFAGVYGEDRMKTEQELVSLINKHFGMK